MTSILPRVFLGTVSACSAALGTWQVMRYNEKVSAINNARTHKVEPPIAISSAESIDDTFIGKRVLLTGKYACGREIQLGPRAGQNLPGFKKAQGMGTNQQGYYVITPFKLQNNGGTVFVNRGWVPMKAFEWSMPTQTQTVQALVRSPEKENFFSPKNSPESGILIWLQEEALKKGTNCETLDKVVVVDRVIENTEVQTELPYCPTVENMEATSIPPEMHATYAAVWYTFAALSFFALYMANQIRRGKVPRNFPKKPIK